MGGGYSRDWKKVRRALEIAILFAGGVCMQLRVRRYPRIEQDWLHKTWNMEIRAVTGEVMD